MRARFRVEGRVQGVGFRWWAQEQAQALGLAGFVRNEPDGAVRGVAEGGAAELEAFRARLAAGPPQARVAGLQWDLDGEADSGGQSCPFPFEIQR